MALGSFGDRMGPGCLSPGALRHLGDVDCRSSSLQPVLPRRRPQALGSVRELENIEF